MGRNIATKRACSADCWSVGEELSTSFRLESKSRLLVEQRRGADFGVAAVIRALGGNLGGRCHAGYRRAVVTWRRTVQPMAGLIGPVITNNFAVDRLIYPEV
jgi:hypothetical protein